MRGLLDFLSTLEFRPRLINVRVAREMLEQYPCLFFRQLLRFLAGERERHNKVVELEQLKFSPCRDIDQFRHLLPQSREIGRFRFRICNRLLSKNSAGAGSFLTITSCYWIAAENLGAHLQTRLMLRFANAGAARPKKMTPNSLLPPSRMRHNQ